MLTQLFNRQRHARHGDDSEKGRGFGGRGRRGMEGGERCRDEGHEHHHGRGRGRPGDCDPRDRHMKLRRLFEHGDLRVVLLAFVEKKPSYGYELIKAIEEATSGLYVPSPGVIYPTLSLLEEQGYIETIEGEKGRKSFQITAEGQQELKDNQGTVDVIFQRLSHVGKGRNENLGSEIREAVHKLKGLLRENLVRGELSPEQINRIAATLNEAVQRIETEIRSGKDAAESEVAKD